MFATADIVGIGGLILLVAGLAFTIFRQGKNDEKLKVTTDIAAQQAKILSDIEKSKAFEDKLRANPAFADRVRVLTNADK